VRIIGMTPFKDTLLVVFLFCLISVSVKYFTEIGMEYSDTMASTWGMLVLSVYQKFKGWT